MTKVHSQAATVVGERIRARRKRLGLSQEDVADLAEMHVTNIGKIERGQSNPSLTTLVRVAGVLDCDPGSFLAGLSLVDVPSATHKITARELIAARKAQQRDA